MMKLRHAAVEALLIISLTLVAKTNSSTTTPCNNVKIELTTNKNDKLCSAIASQLNVEDIDILQTFTFKNWSILYVDPHVADMVFLFYNSNPLKKHFVYSWSGAAMSNEELSIQNIVINAISNIPQDLAYCFAWHVTRDRDL